MRYFNEHRRKLIKQNYIRGAKATVSDSSATLELVNSVGAGVDYLEIWGSDLSQNGIPTPENPVPIQGTSDNGTVIRIKGSGEEKAISIPLSLHGIDGNYDRLIYSENECYKDVKVIYKSIKDILNAGASYSGWSYEGERRVSITWFGYPAKTDSDLYCTHAPIKDSVSGYSGLCFEMFGCEIVFYDYWQNTAEEFIDWLIENDVKVAYALDIIDREYPDAIPPIKEYTKNLPCIIEAQPATATKIVATYYTSENEDTYSITVHYKDTKSSELLESKTSGIRCNSRYTVIPPEIKGYEPLQDKFEGYLTENKEITVIYKEK